MGVKKILFDIPTEHGTARPDFLISLLDKETGRELKLALQVLQSSDEKYLELRSIERERLQELGPVISFTVEDLTVSEITARVIAVLR